MSGRSSTGRIGALLELGKFQLVDLWFGFLVALALGLPTILGSGGAALSFGLTVVTLILVGGLTCSVDDIVGLRDGVDAINHRGARFGVRKPLLDGRLTERQAVEFSLLLAAAIGAGTLAVFVIAPSVPWWLCALHVVACLYPVNYSWGLKLSYRGLGGIAVFIWGAGSVLLPYGFACGSVPPAVWVSAMLVGLWIGQIVMFSNTMDAAGDRATGRLTIAARTSAGGNRVFIVAVHALGLIASWVVLWAAGLGWLCVVLVPVWIAQGVQLYRGVVRGDWMGARRMGFRIFRSGCLLLAVAGLLVGGL